MYQIWRKQMAENKTFQKKRRLFCIIVTHSVLPSLAFGFISFWQSCKRKGKKQQDARGDNKKGGDRCIEASKEVERLWRQRWNSESSITAFTWQWWSLVGEWGEIKAGSTQLRVFWIIAQLQFRNHVSQSNFGEILSVQNTIFVHFWMHSKHSQIYAEDESCQKSSILMTKMMQKSRSRRDL